MCKGLGRLERFIFNRTLQQPVWLRCGALAKDAGVSGKSMARAMHSFTRKFPRFAVQGGIGRTHHLFLYEPTADPSGIATTTTFAQRQEDIQMRRSAIRAS